MPDATWYSGISFVMAWLLTQKCANGQVYAPTITASSSVQVVGSFACIFARAPPGQLAGRALKTFGPPGRSVVTRTLTGASSIIEPSSANARVLSGWPTFDSSAQSTAAISGCAQSSTSSTARAAMARSTAW